MEPRNYVMINNYKLLTTFQVIHLQKLPNQYQMVLLWQRSDKYMKLQWTESDKNFVNLIKRENVLIKKWIYGEWKYVGFAEYKSWLKASEDNKVVFSQTVYQMAMKGNVSLPFKV